MKKEGLREQHQTIRQQMIDLLRRSEMSALDISQCLGIMEKEVYDHLAHLCRTAQSHGQRCVIVPCQCLGCGYTFTDRKKFTRPGRCPQCKQTHIQTARFRIAAD